VSCIECTSSCIECVGWKLGCLEVWWLGGIYSPNHQSGRWGRLLSKGAPDSPVHQPRHPTVGVRPLELWQVGPPDSHCSLSGAPSGACSDSVRAVRALFTHCSLLQTTVGAVSRCSAWHTGQSGATPDSPVNYSGVAFLETRSWAVRVDSPWCIGHCPVAHRTVRCARPGQPSIFIAPFIWTLYYNFVLVCCEPLAPVEHIF
jgi:hypothetical protein